MNTTTAEIKLSTNYLGKWLGKSTCYVSDDLTHVWFGEEWIELTKDDETEDYLFDAAGSIQRLTIIYSPQTYGPEDIEPALVDMVSLWEKLIPSFPTLRDEPAYVKAKAVLAKAPINPLNTTNNGK